MSAAKAKKLKCRTCGRELAFASARKQPYFPFCSARCRNLDLGRWFNEQYTIPGETAADVDPDAPGQTPSETSNR